MALNLVTFCLVLLAIWQKNVSKFLTVTVLFLLVLQILVSGQINGSTVRAELVASQGDSVETDMRGFIKTYQLMKTGENFYDAFQKGMTAAMHVSFAVDIGGWREPFVFYLWTLLPGNGVAIYYLFELLTAGTLVAAYFIARKFLPARFALLSPFILFPYFHYPLSDLTLLQVEWWGMFFLVLGLGFYFYQRMFAAGIFFALALLTRELYLIPIAGLILLKPKAKLIAPLVVPLAFYFLIHLPNIFARGAVISRGFGARKDLAAINFPLAFSSWNYLLGIYRPFLILTIVSMMRGWRNFVILASWIPFFLITVFMATNGVIDQWHDYWGIYFMPLLLVSAPILILPPGK